jgi:hypothetical protein
MPFLSGEKHFRWKGGKCIQNKCQICKKIFYRYPSQKGRFCSRECVLKYMQEINLKRDYTKNNKRFKGFYYDRKGYKHIYKPDHPFAREKHIPEHTLVIEKKLGRYLRPGEVVHHIDFNPSNNDPRNLYLFSSQKAHFQYEQNIIKTWKKIYREFTWIKD